MKSLLNVLLAPLRAITAPFRIVLNWVTRLISVPGRVWGLSLPTRVAVLLAIFLVLAVVVTGILVYTATPSAAHWRNLLTPGRLFVGFVLLIAIPLVARQVVLRFLEGNISSFPEIDAAWDAGITALRQNGLDLNELPVFLILGVRDRREVDAIINGAGSELLVKAVPEGDKPLRWYASAKAIFLACPRMGCLPLSTATAVSGEVSGGGRDLFKTLGGDDFGFNEDAETEEIEPETTAWGTLMGTLRGTLTRGTLVPDRPRPGGEPELAAGRRRDEIQRETSHLTHLAKLLRRARQPFCPLNGIVMLVPWDVVQDTRRAPHQLPLDLHRDVTTFSTAAEISVPATVLITGMESEPGFLELVRRVGREKCRQRFGKGFEPISNVPTPRGMEALAEHALFAFEHWVYLLFDRPDGLRKPNNGQLYGLLCKVRTRLADRLTRLLTKGFGSQSERCRRILLGIYFGATGQSPDQRCFIEGVFDKVIQNDDEVEWTERAAATDRRYVLWSQIASFCNALVAFGIVAMIILFYWWKNTEGGP